MKPDLRSKSRRFNVTQDGAIVHSDQGDYFPWYEHCRIVDELKARIEELDVLARADIKRLKGELKIARKR